MERKKVKNSVVQGKVFTVAFLSMKRNASSLLEQCTVCSLLGCNNCSSVCAIHMYLCQKI